MLYLSIFLYFLFAYSFSFTHITDKMFLPSVLWEWLARPSCSMRGLWDKTVHDKNIYIYIYPMLTLTCLVLSESFTIFYSLVYYLYWCFLFVFSFFFLIFILVNPRFICVLVNKCWVNIKLMFFDMIWRDKKKKYCSCVYIFINGIFVFIFLFIINHIITFLLYIKFIFLHFHRQVSGKLLCWTLPRTIDIIQSLDDWDTGGRRATGWHIN